MDVEVDEPVEALSIGSVVGGPNSSNQPWTDAITDLCRRVAASRPETPADLNVNIVFHVPGHIIQPDYSGVRTGTYSSKQALLMVQVALPEEPPEDVPGFVRAAAHGALDEAERWARRRRLNAGLDNLRAILDRC
jgi:hypothetical protein